MSAEKDIEARLTPAAKAALESYLADTRAEILNAARAISASLSDYAEIGVSEVLQAVNSQRESDKQRASELRLERLRLLTATAATLGLILFVAGVVTYAFQFIRSSNWVHSWAAVSISAGLAVFASAFSLYFVTATTRRVRLAEKSSERQEQRSLGEFLLRWSEFNRAVDLFVAKRFGESAANPGLGRKLMLLDDHNIFTPEDTAEVKRMYNMRNRLVHGTSDDQPTQEQVQNALVELVKLQNKLTHAAES